MLQVSHDDVTAIIDTCLSNATDSARECLGCMGSICVVDQIDQHCARTQTAQLCTCVLSCLRLLQAAHLSSLQVNHDNVFAVIDTCFSKAIDSAENAA